MMSDMVWITLRNSIRSNRNKVRDVRLGKIGKAFPFISLLPATPIVHLGSAVVSPGVIFRVGDVPQPWTVLPRAISYQTFFKTDSTI